MHRNFKPIAAALIGMTGLAIAAQGGAGQPDDAPLGERLAERYQRVMGNGGMQRWQQSMTPELAHAFLAEHFVGKWTAEAKIMGMGNGLDASWEVEGRPILGGRFVEQRAVGTMMGMPTESKMVLGYDNVRKLFHATMFDSMSTGVRTLWGNLDKTGKVLTLVGAMDEPMSGEIGKSFMITWRFGDDGVQDYEVKEILYGDAFPVVSARSEPAG